MTPEEFRKYGHAVVDWIADYRTRVHERPVMAQTAPGEIKARLPAAPPDAARAVRRRCSRDLDDGRRAGPVALAASAVLRLLPQQRHARAACSATTSAPASACSAWRGSRVPALTEVEEVVTDWLRQMAGLSDAWSGVIQDTASTSTLVAL